MHISISKFTMTQPNCLLPLSIAILVLQIVTRSHALQGKNCTYRIEIETTCTASAETTDHISLRFSDSSGNLVIVKHLKNPKLLDAPKSWKEQTNAYSGFGRCAIDMFEASGTCMSDWICSLYLKRIGSDGWRPGWVKVLKQQNGHAVPVSFTFYFRTFLPANVWYGFNYCHS